MKRAGRSRKGAAREFTIEKTIKATIKHMKPTIKSLIKPVFAGIGVFLMAGCSTMTKAPTDATPSATVRIQSVSAAYYGSASTGEGILNYHGNRHHFSIASLGVGGTGAHSMSATGTVYNLNRLSDFSGTYRGVSSGLTLGKGKTQAKLTNGNGVIMHFTGKTSGLSTSGGVQSYDVRLSH